MQLQFETSTAREDEVISSIIVADYIGLRRFSFLLKNRHSMRFVAPPLPKIPDFWDPVLALRQAVLHGRPGGLFYLSQFDVY